MFNSKIKRNKISNEEFYFSFEVAKRQKDNDKIIIPKFEFQDIIYCFIQILRKWRKLLYNYSKSQFNY